MVGSASNIWCAIALAVNVCAAIISNEAGWKVPTGKRDESAQVLVLYRNSFGQLSNQCICLPPSSNTGSGSAGGNPAQVAVPVGAGSSSGSGSSDGTNSPRIGPVGDSSGAQSSSGNASSPAGSGTGTGLVQVYVNVYVNILVATSLSIAGSGQTITLTNTVTTTTTMTTMSTVQNSGGQGIGALSTSATVPFNNGTASTIGTNTITQTLTSSLSSVQVSQTSSTSPSANAILRTQQITARSINALSRHRKRATCDAFSFTINVTYDASRQCTNFLDGYVVVQAIGSFSQNGATTALSLVVSSQVCFYPTRPSTYFDQTGIVFEDAQDNRYHQLTRTNGQPVLELQVQATIQCVIEDTFGNVPSSTTLNISSTSAIVDSTITSAISSSASTCTPDQCMSAILAAPTGLKDCSSYARATVLPDASTTKETSTTSTTDVELFYSTTTRSFSTLSLTTVTSTSTVTVTRTPAPSTSTHTMVTSKLITILTTSVTTNTVTTSTRSTTLVQKRAVTAEYMPQAHDDVYRNIGRREYTTSMATLPTYAAICDIDGYRSACSCLGAVPSSSTVTLDATTVTTRVTVTVTAAESDFTTIEQDVTSTITSSVITVSDETTVTTLQPESTDFTIISTQTTDIATSTVQSTSRIETSAVATFALRYVGSWHVGDGPVWSSGPPVYSGQDAAASLFGGQSAEYSISTVDNTIANINYMSWTDGYATTASIRAQNAKSGSPNYVQPGDYSAYVLDHLCDNRYSDMSQKCPANDNHINYAFRSVQI